VETNEIAPKKIGNRFIKPNQAVYFGAYFMIKPTCRTEIQFRAVVWEKLKNSLPVCECQIENIGFN
jgi:hypothetical protein